MNYNPSTMSLHRTTLLILAAFVAVFVALYPYLGAADMCGHGECPYAAQSGNPTSGGVACVVAVLAAYSAAGLASTTFRRRRLPAVDRRPTQIYLSPDPPPPLL